MGSVAREGGCCVGCGCVWRIGGAGSYSTFPFGIKPHVGQYPCGITCRRAISHTINFYIITYCNINLSRWVATLLVPEFLNRVSVGMGEMRCIDGRRIDFPNGRLWVAARFDACHIVFWPDVCADQPDARERQGNAMCTLQPR